MSKEISPQLTQFRNASAIFSNVAMSSPDKDAAPVRAGLRVWLKSFFDIGDARERNRQTIEAFRNAVLSSPRYAGALADQARGLLDRLTPWRPLSSRNIVKTLTALEGVRREEKNRAITRERIASICSVSNNAHFNSVMEPVTKLHGYGDPDPMSLKGFIDKSLMTAPAIRKHDYSKGPITEQKLTDLRMEKLKIVTDCLAMLNKNRARRPLRQLLWQQTFANKAPINDNLPKNMEKELAKLEKQYLREIDKLAANSL
ncbi:hypothetical protein LJC15_00485 [Desulfovibrio sp. OttesenSCG-928-G11]|nr:hypothetical protein [Desulfovibrio sp. OttesenSCG-928-G11]